MKGDFLSILMGNPTRATVLRMFVFNQSQLFALGMVAKRTELTPQAATKEIKLLEQWGVIKKGKLSITLGKGAKRLVEGKQKEQTWTMDHGFKHVAALSKFVHEVSPVEYGNVLEVLKRTGRLSSVILSGSFMGDPSRPADLILAADGVSEPRLDAAVHALEKQFAREIRYAAFSTSEFSYRLTVQDRLIRDTLDYPHLVLLDKSKLL